MESCIPFWVNAECKTKEDAHNEMMKIFLNLQEEKINLNMQNTKIYKNNI